MHEALICIKLQRIASQKENIQLKKLLIAISAMDSSAAQHGDKNQSGNTLMISESMGAGGSPDTDQQCQDFEAGYKIVAGSADATELANILDVTTNTPFSVNNPS